YPHNCDNGGPAARASQHTLPRSQLFHHCKAIGIAHHDDLVANRAVKRRGTEARSDSFHFVGSRLSSTEDRSLCFDGDRHDSGQALFQIPPNPRESAARAIAQYYGVNLPFHLLEDFGGGRL